MRKIVIITGPTAVGKTEYAMRAAEKFDGEIVSCDSMQIYKYMDIGSAKPSADERNRIRHHLVDDIDPKVSFSAASYEKMAKSCIEDIFNRGKLPIIAGGTGLYLNSLIYEMAFGKIPAQEKFRRKLEEMAEESGGAYLFELLRKKAPQAAERIHPNNVRKIIRALESAEFSEEGPEDFSKLKTKTRDYDIVMIGLTRNRAELYERINRRVDAMMREGLAEEVKNLIKMGLSEDNISMKGIGYKECIAYLKDEYDLERAVELIKRNTRHFAKRQMTWLRRYDEMKWFDLSKYCDSSENAFKDIEKHIKEALKA